MAVNVKTGTAAGADQFFYGVRDDSGNLVGGESATAPTAGDTNGNAMVQLKLIKDFPLAPVEPESVPVTGDDGIASKFKFKPSDFPENQMTFGSGDLDFNALVQSTLVQDVAGWSFGSVQPADPIYRQMIYIVQGNSFSQENASLNTAEWYVQIMLNVQTAPLHRGSFTERAAGDFLYSNTMNEASNTPWGVDFTDVDDGTAAMVAMEFFSQYPVTIHRFTGNNIETDYILDLTPVDSADWMVVTLDGVVKTYTTDYTITAATKIVAFEAGSIPTDGAIIEIFYGFVI